MRRPWDSRRSTPDLLTLSTYGIAALAYDGVKLLADAITRAGSTEGPKLRDALATADLPGVTGRLKMNAKRNVDKPAVIEEGG